MARRVDAGLDDWRLEMSKVLLLASLGGLALEQVLLFERAEGDILHWLRIDERGLAIRTASSRAVHEKIAAPPPGRADVQIDRAWAIAAVEAMIQSQN